MNVERNQLPKPSNCDNCGSSNVGLTSNATLYGTEKGNWPYCYYCSDCGASSSCHSNTYNPMGLMATGATRRLRGKLHAVFDPIWRNDYLSRELAYNWLGKELGLTVECHISHLTKDELKKAILILSAHVVNDYAMFKRRKVKSNAKRFDRKQREGARISLRKARYQP